MKQFAEQISVHTRSDQISTSAHQTATQSAQELSPVKVVEEKVAQEDTALLEIREKVDFWQYWSDNRDYLRRLSYRWMNISAMDAEDALSDATVRAFDKFKIHADAITNERAWLARLLHNICIDIHRSNKRRGNLFDRVKEINDIQDTCVITAEPSPEQALLNSELGAHIKHAIEQLPEKIKIPIILRLVRGDDYSQIALRLNISNDNVRKRVQQGRAILREKLSHLK